MYYMLLFIKFPQINGNWIRGQILGKCTGQGLGFYVTIS